MARGLGAFAEGLMTGFTTGKKNQREEEEYQLRMAKLKDERAMAEEFKAVDAQSKPAEGFVLVTADGSRTVFADKKMAEEAKAAMGGDAKLEQKFIVAGQQFDTAEAADIAAEAANAPAAKLRKRADIALKYNRPDVADAYTKSYQNMIEANRRDMQETFLQAQQTGDYSSVLDAYNKRLPNGATAEMVPNEQGGMTLQVTRGGKVVTQKPFASPDEFWTTMGQQIATTPDNMLETWKTRESLAAQKRGLDIQERSADANIRQGDERLAQSAKGLTLQERQVDAGIKNDAARTRIAQGQLGVAQGELGLKSSIANRPDVVSGVAPNGNVVFSATERYRDENGNWGLRVHPTQEVPGMAPTRTAAPDPFAGLTLPGGAQQPLVIDWGKIPQKNIGGPAPAPQQPQNPLVNQIPR